MSEEILNGVHDHTLKKRLANSSKRVILALQHLIAMFGASISSHITGFNPSIALFSAE